MGAPEGNQYWRLRSRSGLFRKFETPEELEEACDAYFEEMADMAWPGTAIRMPLTTAGLCRHIGITQKTWIEWRANREDLREVITRVDELIADQKLTGAMVGQYKENIVARDLKLSDKTENDTTVTHKGLSDFYGGNGNT